jgi:hypothetical protein
LSADIKRAQKDNKAELKKLNKLWNIGKIYVYCYKNKSVCF